MAYPVDKELFRRVVGENLAEGIPGDVVIADDQNNPANFLERLQDTLGLEVQGAFPSVADRLNSLSSFSNMKQIKFFQQASVAIADGVSEVGPFGTIENLETGQRVAFLLSVRYHGNADGSYAQIDPYYNIDGGAYSSLQTGYLFKSAVGKRDDWHAWITEKKPVISGQVFGIAIKATSGLFSGSIYYPSCIAIVYTE